MEIILKAANDRMNFLNEQATELDSYIEDKIRIIVISDSDSEMEESNYRKNKLADKKKVPLTSDYNKERKIFEKRNEKQTHIGNKFVRTKYYFLDYYDMAEKPRNEEGFNDILIEMARQLEYCQTGKRIKREEEQEEEVKN
jgi:hypothetical protein